MIVVLPIVALAVIAQRVTEYQGAAEGWVGVRIGSRGGGIGFSLSRSFDISLGGGISIGLSRSVGVGLGSGKGILRLSGGENISLSGRGSMNGLGSSVISASGSIIGLGIGSIIGLSSSRRIVRCCLVGDGNIEQASAGQK